MYASSMAGGSRSPRMSGFTGQTKGASRGFLEQRSRRRRSLKRRTCPGNGLTPILIANESGDITKEVPLSCRGLPLLNACAHAYDGDVASNACASTWLRLYSTHLHRFIRV